MDTTLFMKPGDIKHFNFVDNGTKTGICLETSILDFERKYLIRFEDSSELWMSQYTIRHLGTEN